MDNDSYPTPPDYQEPERPIEAPLSPRPPVVVPPAPPSKSAMTILPKIFGVVGIILVVILSAIGGYLLRDQTGKHSVIPATITTQSTAPHLVTTVGFPSGTTSTVTTKLGFPSNLDAVQSTTKSGNTGVFAYFSNQESDAMGRWMVGDPTSTTNQPIGDITLINLNRPTWYPLPLPSGSAPFAGTPPATELLTANTPFAKAGAIESYINRIQACAQDPTKGVVVSGFMNICVTPEILPPQAASIFRSQAVIEGYGKQGSIELLLIGTISLETNANLTPANQKQLSITGKNGQKPASINDRTKAIRTALAASTITIINTVK